MGSGGGGIRTKSGGVRAESGGVQAESRGVRPIIQSKRIEQRSWIYKRTMAGK